MPTPPTIDYGKLFQPPSSITIARSTLQVVFDTAVGSMDFGSGFLDNEEVSALRACATALGVCPCKATPSNHVANYYGRERHPYGGHNLVYGEGDKPEDCCEHYRH